MASYYRSVARALRIAGWHLYRQGKGSHEIWSRLSDPDGVKITVPSNIKKEWMAEGVMKLAGLDKQDYKLSERALKQKLRTPENPVEDSSEEEGV